MAETLAQRIRRARLHRAITQTELAALVGISRTAMHQLEKGETRDPRMAHLCTLADVLGVTMDYLAGRRDTPPPKRPRPRKAVPVG
jgi:transcriptional regulator with XRE-family HTH domain